MPNRWWRAYESALDDPKLIMISDAAHRLWFNLLCLASKHEGRIPERNFLKKRLKFSQKKLEKLLSELKNIGLIDEDEEGLFPHNWLKRQFKSDSSTPRVKRFREGKRNVTETPPENRVQSTEKKGREEPAASGGSSPFVFDRGTVRLNAQDFAAWEQAFTEINLRAELESLYEWAEGQPNWFMALKGALAKRNREARLRKEAIQIEQGAPRKRKITGGGWA